ncbi:MAG: HNH endonuclease family protein, partial [Desulfovibrionaceae bacterium]|nr:HNH endonuclease family protein [Desulfovibrionaceae bacterium]
YEQIHETWLHRIANLTLTGYNSKYSNSSFAEKRDMEKGFKQSGLRLNAWIAKQEHWGLKELEERNQLLMQTALKTWPLP